MRRLSPSLARGVRLGALALLLGLAGCADMGYYWQAVRGHWGVVAAARPVEDWLSDAQTDARLRERLRLAQAIRTFASRELGLPDNASYRRYADLRRSAVVWNVVAAPSDSLLPYQWCFAVVGCVTYRGYFSESEARAEAARLSEQGYETDVHPVPAYSTLGWTNWLGGDPLLNTFMGQSDADLARLIFHELTHQWIYVADDTVFNESLATVVERIGVQRWLVANATPQARDADQALGARRAAFRQLSRATRSDLAEAYARGPGQSPTTRAAEKAAAMARFRSAYQALRTNWGLTSGTQTQLDLWVARANNASFAAQGAYDDAVPALERLFESQSSDLRRFYDAVTVLAGLTRIERAKRLKELNGG